MPASLSSSWCASYERRAARDRREQRDRSRRVRGALALDAAQLSDSLPLAFSTWLASVRVVRLRPRPHWASGCRRVDLLPLGGSSRHGDETSHLLGFLLPLGLALPTPASSSPEAPHLHYSACLLVRRGSGLLSLTVPSCLFSFFFFSLSLLVRPVRPVSTEPC